MNVEKFQSLTFGIEKSPAELLDDEKLILGLLEKISKIANLTVVGELVRKFEPQGITAILALSESHVAIHTWPEKSRAYITLTTCSSVNFEKKQQIAQEILKSLRTEKIITKETKC